MSEATNTSSGRLDPAAYGGALLPGEGALVSGFPHEKIWFGEPAADAKLPKPDDGNGDPLDLDRLKANIVRVRRALHKIIVDNAPTEGWSEDEAHQIASQAELIFFRAVERGATTEGATHLAIALAQRAHAAWAIMSAADNGKDPADVFEKIIEQKLDATNETDVRKMDAARTAFNAAVGRGAPLEAAFYQALDATAAIGDQ